MHLPTYLTLLSAAEETLATTYDQVGTGHAEEPEVFYPCTGFARRCREHVDKLAPLSSPYEDRRQPEPERLLPIEPGTCREGPIGLLRDLQDLDQLANLVDSTWSLVRQAAAGARDRALLDVAANCHPDITTQLAWLRMRMRAAAAQTLLVAP